MNLHIVPITRYGITLVMLDGAEQRAEYYADATGDLLAEVSAGRDAAFVAFNDGSGVRIPRDAAWPEAAYAEAVLFPGKVLQPQG